MGGDRPAVWGTPPPSELPLRASCLAVPDTGEWGVHPVRVSAGLLPGKWLPVVGSGAAVTKDHSLGPLKLQESLPYSPGGRSLEVWQGSRSLRGSGGGSFRLGPAPRGPSIPGLWPCPPVSVPASRGLPSCCASDL